MNKLFQRWLDLSLKHQIAVFTLSMLMLISAAAGLWYTPVQQKSTDLKTQLRQMNSRYQQQLRALSAQGRQANIRADIVQLQQALMPDKKKAFSLQQLIEASGSTLVEWQPAGRGGYLVLLLRWPQVQQVFRYFSALPAGEGPAAFTLKPDKQQLRLQLSLAAADDE